MKDVKKGARLVENEVKEASRKLDGDVSTSDKPADLGDDVRHGLGNAADKAHEDVNKVARDLERRMQEDERRDRGPAPEVEVAHHQNNSPRPARSGAVPLAVPCTEGTGCVRVVGVPTPR